MSQAQFVTAILDPNAPVPEGLHDPEGRAAGKRFDVYRNNVVVSLIGALRDGFPAIASLLGAEYFDAAAGLFARATPPSDPRLTLYGVEFPEFLDGFEPLAHLPYLGDVARLELALRQSYHAADHKAFPPDRLALMRPPELSALTLALAPSAKLMASAFPIVDIRAKALGGAMQQKTAQDVLIARPDYDPQPYALPAGGLRFLSELGAGRTLGEAAALAGEDAPEFDLSAVLGLALSTGILTERP